MASTKGALNILGAWRYQVFSGPAFPGNPTTLHLLKGGASKAAMLAHSRSLVTIDNAYYYPTSEKDIYRVSAYSHHSEILICGHALLAVAHHLQPPAHDAAIELMTAAFKHQAHWLDQRIWISLPALQSQALHLPVLHNALAAAGLRVDALLQFPSNVWVAVTNDLDALAAFSVAHFPWSKFDSLKPGALILCAAMGETGYSYRYFSPWFGKPEDSATGSAHCYLASHWLRDGEYASACQLSPAGTAQMQVHLHHDHVWLCGNVVALRDLSS